MKSTTASRSLMSSPPLLPTPLPKPSSLLPALRSSKASARQLRLPAHLSAAAVVTAISACFSAPAHAQQAPAAPLRNSPQAAPAPAAAASSPQASTTRAAPARFTLNTIGFTDTRAVPADELQAVVKPFLHREIDSTDLTVMATAIRRLYADRGFGLAGVGFPTQDLSKGVLQISIVEPQVKRITVDSTGAPPLSAERVTQVLARSGVHSGDPLDLQSLDNAMFTLNDWPGVSAKATLMPTGDEGLYNVAVQTERRRGWDASVDADNHGSKVSGRYRLGALLRWNNPSGIGDNLDLRALASNGQGTTVGRLGYEAPLGATPWRGGVGYSRVGYELGEQFEDANAVGHADVIDASLSYPFIRARDKNLVARFGLASKKLVDEFGPLRSDKNIRAADLTLSFEARDALLGGAFNGGSISLQTGRLSIDTESERQFDADRGSAATQGRYSKIGVQLSRLQALSGPFSLFFGAAGQWASKNLDNAEKFTLGGDKGVRAYPAAEGSSDEGAILNAELRYWINPQWSSYGFYDVGRGKAHKRPFGSDANYRTLQGLGLGVQYSHPELLTLKASLAFRGHEDVLSEDDNARARLLVQVQHSF